jgi:hypothetical protein
VAQRLREVAVLPAAADVDSSSGKPRSLENARRRSKSSFASPGRSLTAGGAHRVDRPPHALVGARQEVDERDVEHAGVQASDPS